VAFWRPLLPPRVRWFREVGGKLRVQLDHRKEDLNAFYDGKGLQFFHAAVGKEVVYTAESPDLVCHELGHAVLDGLRPQLFNVAGTEVAAFHEAFADISAMLSALQIESVRTSVLEETRGDLTRSSRLSRFAEQLGWATGSWEPDSVDAGCLRNAVNSHFYSDPTTLPSLAPANLLSSEPHSFSRVFSGGFLQALARMLKMRKKPGQQYLRQISRDLGQLLVDAVWNAPIIPAYFSQIAAHMIEADEKRFNRKYHRALLDGFIRHGILSHDATEIGSDQAVSPRRAWSARPDDPAKPARVSIAAGRFGFEINIHPRSPSESSRFDVSGAAPDVGSITPPTHMAAAASFLEDLFRRGKVDPQGLQAREAPFSDSFKTHEVRQRGKRLVLVRRLFNCASAIPRTPLGSG
jgi:hypothetical protein